MGAPATKIFKVAYASDVERFAVKVRARPKERAHRLLFCGQLVDRKGLFPFLRCPVALGPTTIRTGPSSSFLRVMGRYAAS